MSSNSIIFYLYLNIIVYITPLIFFYLYLEGSDNSLNVLGQFNKKLFFVKFTFILILLNLAGIPPLPGFFIKLNLFIILMNNTSLIVCLLFTVLNFIIFFFYIKSLKKLSYQTVKHSKRKKYNDNLLLLVLFSYIVLYPLLSYHLMVILYTGGI